MLTSLPIQLIIGTALGFLSGLGIGGGSLLILWLTLALGMDPQTARSINLLFFIPSALVATFLRFRSGNLKIAPLIPAIISGCISAALSAYISKSINIEVLRKLFGVILLVTAIREIFFSKKGSSK